MVAAAEDLAGEVTAEEQALLGLLAAFVGGADLSTLSRCAPFAGRSVLELAERLARLAERSVVLRRTRRGRTRYSLAKGALEGLGSEPWRMARLEEARRQQRAWCERLVARADEELAEWGDERRWLWRLGAERRNLQAALDGSLCEGDLLAAAGLATRLCRLWELRGPFGEARRAICRVLAAGPVEEAVRARLLDGLGVLAWRQGDYDEARRAQQEAVILSDPGSDALQAARARRHLALTLLCTGEAGAARQLLELCRSDLEGADAPGELAHLWSLTALCALVEGLEGLAEAELGRALELQRALGDAQGSATSLLLRALARYRCGERPSALSDARRAARRFRRLGDEASLAWAMHVMARAWPAGDPVPARELERLARRLLARRGGRVHLGWLLEAGAAPPARTLTAAGVRGHQDEGRRAKACGEDLPERVPERPAGPVSIEVLGTFRLRRAGVVRHLAPQVARLVKLLVLSPEGLHVDQVVEQLWPETDPRTGRRRLRNVASRLARAAGPLLLRNGDHLRLVEGVEVDAWAFADAARDALVALQQGADPREALDRARRAHGRYTGDLLPEDRYEDFAIEARERLVRLRLRLLDAAADAAAAAGELAAAERCLRIAVEVDPADERRYVLLAGLLVSTGRYAAAARVCAMARELASELDLPVSPAVAELEASLRTAPAGS